jgi:hypothetical protein
MLSFFGLGPTKGLQGQSGCADLPHGELRAGRLYKGPILLRTQGLQFAVQPFGGEDRRAEQPDGQRVAVVVVGYSALFCRAASFSLSSSSAPLVDDDAAEKTALRLEHRGRHPFSTISPLRDQLLAGEIRRVGNAVNGRWAADLMLCQAGASAQSRPDAAALPGPRRASVTN